MCLELALSIHPSAFSCKAGEFLDMETQECQKCAAGTFSLGTGVWFDDWDRLPAGFFSYGADASMGDAVSNCSKSVSQQESSARAVGGGFGGTLVPET